MVSWVKKDGKLLSNNFKKNTIFNIKVQAKNTCRLLFRNCLSNVSGADGLKVLECAVNAEWGGGTVQWALM